MPANRFKPVQATLVQHVTYSSAVYTRTFSVHTQTNELSDAHPFLFYPPLRVPEGGAVHWQAFLDAIFQRLRHNEHGSLRD